jgi:transposase
MVQWPRQAIWLYGAVAPATGDSFFFEYSHLDGDCFEHFLQQMAQQFPEFLNVIQLDGAGAHIKASIEIPDNIVLLFQPAHSPELNPIERLWLDLKIDLRGENFANLDQLRQAVCEVLGYMTHEWIAAMTQYPFIMNAPSVASIS